ncbi:MAG: 3'-5' exonuclease [Bacteroidetes bacterium]|nr:MAG: 3'-5' exonuclease [Bacteroidota bacterium]
MLDKIALKNILFLDVETVPQVEDFNQLSPALQDLWVKKAQRIAPADQEPVAEELFFEKAGIYSEFGKIVCISAGFFYGDDDDLKFRCKAFYSDKESELLTNFAALLRSSFNQHHHYLCGHNAREFDFPYIARRMLINQIPLPDILNIPGRKPWEVTLLDTMDLWKFGDYKNYTSLALLAAVFDIPTPKDDIQGSDVARVYWKEKDLNRIAVYCNKDVVTTARLYLKYCVKGELTDENVESLV